MNEPKKYEVQMRAQDCDWVVFSSTDDPVRWIKNTPSDIQFRFKLPNGPLFRVEPKSIKPHGSDLDIAVTEAHLVRIPVEPEGQPQPAQEIEELRKELERENRMHAVFKQTNASGQIKLASARKERDAARAQLSSQTTKGGETCATQPQSFSQSPVAAQRATLESTTQDAPTVASNAPLDVQPVEPVPTPVPQRETDWQNIEAKDAQIGDELSYSGENWLAINEEETVRRFHAGELTGYRLRRAVMAQRETEWRKIEAKDVQTGDQFRFESYSWVDFSPDYLAACLSDPHEWQRDGFTFRRPIPAQREGTDGTPEQREIAELRETLSFIEMGEEATYFRNRHEEALKNVAAQAKLYARDVMKLTADKAALQAERDALTGQLTKIGNACIAGITEAAEDRQETDPEILWKAISESVRLGHERNDEANALRRQLAEARQHVQELQESGDSDLSAMLEQLNDENNKLTASLAAAEREKEAMRLDLLTAIDESNKASNIIYAMQSALKPNVGEKSVECAIRVAQSLTAAKAELATCREEATKVLRALEGTENFKEDCECGPCKAVRILRALTTPPPSAQA